jgi:trimethylamine--corrinoid protein Co-methyltransferase
MSDIDVVKSQITVLSQEQMTRIHAASLQILSTVGIRVDSERARQVFARAIGRTAADGRVRIPRQLVERALATAPSSVEVYDRRGNPAFRLGSPMKNGPNGEVQTRFGIGVTALYYQDPETDEVVPFTRKHMEMTVRLGGALPSFDAVSTVGIVQDVPPKASDLYAVLEMVANTVKPLVILVSDEE